MKCPGEEKLLLYFYKELSIEEQIEISSHILICDKCKKHIESLNNISKSLPNKESLEFKDQFVLNYSRNKLKEKLWSLNGKIFAFAFSTILIMFLIVPKQNERNIDKDLDEVINSVENEISAFKYDLLDSQGEYFNYKVYESDKSDNW